MCGRNQQQGKGKAHMSKQGRRRAELEAVLATHQHTAPREDGCVDEHVIQDARLLFDLQFRSGFVYSIEVI